MGRQGSLITIILVLGAAPDSWMFILILYVCMATLMLYVLCLRMICPASAARHLRNVTQYANTIHNGTVLPYSLHQLLYHVSVATLNLSEVIEIVAICAAMAAADPDVISSKSSDPEDELRDKFELGFDSNGVLRQYDNKSSEITERSFQFDVHSGDKKRNQERRISIKTMAIRILQSTWALWIGTKQFVHIALFL